jgi:Pyruvate/2-oxoacid:ferredoxin oxidoreductase gamma subunit
MPAASPISSVNDFVVRFANVNGSGSASANELFARSILRHGVPVSPRNIFPSNIQGLPTWYEVRVTEDGHLGARGGVDMMVAMNPQTWDKDVAMIEPGGYLFYDSTKPMPSSKFREDITVIGVPLTAITNSTYTDPRQRQLFKNIIYLGALSALFDMEPKLIEALIGEQYKGKEKLLSSNVHALHLGRDWALQNLKCPIGLRVRKADKVGDRIFIEGNSAAALGAIVVARRRLHQPLQAAASRPRNRQGQIRDHPGRGRTRLDRHRDRRGLERLPGVHRHLRSRHLVDAGVHRPLLLCRNPGRHHGRAARRSLDRHADADPAVRHHQRRLRLAR